jgi:hypothetical protein
MLRAATKSSTGRETLTFEFPASIGGELTGEPPHFSLARPSFCLSSHFILSTRQFSGILGFSSGSSVVEMQLRKILPTLAKRQNSGASTPAVTPS